MNKKTVSSGNRSETTPAGRHIGRRPAGRSGADDRPSDLKPADGDFPGTTRPISAVQPSGGNNSALTAEDRHLLMLIVNGFTNKRIARRLCLSESTIKRRVVQLRNKLGVSNRFELVLAAVSTDYLFKQ